MNKVDILDILLNDVKVGRMTLTPNGLCAFEYAAEWVQTGFSISPFYMPLKTSVIIAKQNPFRGNFGVFDDSLPDGWGAFLLDRLLKTKGINPQQISVLERLALVGNNGRGALTYQPDKVLHFEPEIYSLERMEKEIEKFIASGGAANSLNTLYYYGGSSGGVRPKSFVRLDGKEWLVKFKAATDPEDIGQIEYNYAQLAQKCGIDMPETRLFDGKYFGVARFDREENGRVHTVSAAGLLHADYRTPSLDYSSLLALTQQLTKNMEQVVDMFRRMVFNIVISNRDDHAKNFSFQYRNGHWCLSPAYDLLPSDGFNGFHTTTINGKGAPDLNDVLQIATEVGILHGNALNIINEITTICHEAKMARYSL